jgi:hypothetical protein
MTRTVSLQRLFEMKLELRGLVPLSGVAPGESLTLPSEGLVSLRFVLCPSHSFVDVFFVCVCVCVCECVCV